MKRKAIGFAAVAAVVLGSAVALGAVGAGDGSVHACRAKRHGLLRVPPAGKACKRTETTLNWSVRGPAGAVGATGPRGPAGPPGPPGSGSGGAVSLGALVGTPCGTFDGDPGTISMDVTATDMIVLQCDGPNPPEDDGTGGDGTGGGTTDPGDRSKLVVNEIDYDQVGADTGGFVEIRNGGTAPVTLDGVALVFVNGGDSAEYDRTPLTGTLGAGAYLAVRKDAQNGAPDGVALIDTASGTLLDALSYEGSITAATIGSRTYSLAEGHPLADTVADSNTVDASLARKPDGRDTGDTAADWALTSTPTPGAANVATAMPAS